jgi:hypothetical protein
LFPEFQKNDQSDVWMFYTFAHFPVVERKKLLKEEALLFCSGFHCEDTIMGEWNKEELVVQSLKCVRPPKAIRSHRYRSSCLP